MTETKAPEVDYLEAPDQVERPRWLMPVLLVWIGLVLAGYFAMTYAWSENMPADIPAPSPSSRPWSEDCTAEELNTGVCYLTWDDIREQPTYTQAP